MSRIVVRPIIVTFLLQLNRFSQAKFVLINAMKQVANVCNDKMNIWMIDSIDGINESGKITYAQTI